MTSNKSKLYFRICLLLGILFLSCGLFLMDNSHTFRTSVLFGGVVFGTGAMIFKIVGLLKN